MKNLKATKRTTKAKAPRILDEQTSAFVVAEYLAIENVTEQETSAITDGPIRGGMTYRQIAITFRISEVLDVPVPFAIAPRYRVAFDRAQALLAAHDVIRDASSEVAS